MANVIKGMDITLYEKTQVDIDPFGCPVYQEIPVTVSDVLVSPASSEDIAQTTMLSGKTGVYTLAIPKNDNHVWEDVHVEFFGQKWKSFGIIEEGIEDNIPLRWNKKVLVKRYAA